MHLSVILKSIMRRASKDITRGVSLILGTGFSSIGHELKSDVKERLVKREKLGQLRGKV